MESLVPTVAPRVMVVDDEPDMAWSLRRILKMKGCEVEVAHSGQEAVELASRWTPDGILMDLVMPGLDGVETFRQIRKQCPQAFVIFMTAFSHLVDEARNEDPVEILTKPIDLEAASDLISKSFRVRAK